MNQYAPFYLWTDPSAASTFLFNGGGFTGIVRRYGRPVVQTWIGGTYRTGPAHTAPVTHAVRTVTAVPSDADPALSAEDLQAGLADRLGEADLHSVTWAVDPRTWQIVTLSLHSKRPDTVVGELYEVPYVSAPHERDLPADLG